jgi:hypothetical protein
MMKSRGEAKRTAILGESSEEGPDVQADDNRSSNDWASKDSISSATEEEVQSIHQTSSQNVQPGEKGEEELAHVTTVATNMTTDPAFEVDFDDHDKEDNPKNWSMAIKAMILGFMSFSTLVVVMYSTSYSAGIPGKLIRSYYLNVLPIVGQDMTLNTNWLAF